jgi:hypothetical protein
MEEPLAAERNLRRDGMASTRALHGQSAAVSLSILTICGGPTAGARTSAGDRCTMEACFWNPGGLVSSLSGCPFPKYWASDSLGE